VPIRLVHDRWVSKYAAPFAAALSQLKSKLEGTTMESKVQIYQVFIHTTPEKLWQALTDGEVTKKYFFGETIQSDWKPRLGMALDRPNGARDVEGTVLEADPPRRLVITWHILYDPELSKEQSRVTYLIEKRGEVCKLTATHELAEAPKTAQHVSADGWQLVLSGLKTLLETGEPMPTPGLLRSKSFDPREQLLPDVLGGRSGATEHRDQVGVCAPSATCWRTASSTSRASAAWPRCSSISAPDSAIASGFAFPCPAMSGALPCTGSNSDTWPGWMFPLAAMPSPPVSAAPRSVRMSPNRLLVTITFVRLGLAHQVHG